MKFAAALNQQVVLIDCANLKTDILTILYRFKLLVNSTIEENELNYILISQTIDRVIKLTESNFDSCRFTSKVALVLKD